MAHFVMRKINLYIIRFKVMINFKTKWKTISRRHKIMWLWLWSRQRFRKSIQNKLTVKGINNKLDFANI